MALDKLGNVYVTGRGGPGSTIHYVTIKYNPSGQQQWVQTYIGPNNLSDIANVIAVDDSGNVYVTGGSYKGMIGKQYDWDYATIKYNSSGSQQWVRTYNTLPNGYDVATGICLDENANVYVTGCYGMNTIKYDRNGNQLWLSFYNMSAENCAHKIVYKNGFVYVSGYTNSNSSSYEDYITIKYNANTGSQLWARTYNGTGSQNDEACCVTVDDTGNVFVGGSSVGQGTSWDYVTLKYNAAGVQQWASRYLGDSSNTSQTMSGLVIDNLNNIYVTGTNSGDYCTIKYNNFGLQQWIRIYNSGYNDFSNSITIDKMNNIYVTGSSQFPNPIRNDIVTIQYNSNGSQQWIADYNSIFNSDDYGNVVAIDSSYNVYVTGRSDNSSNISEFVTIKYSQVLGIQNLNEIAVNFELLQNYPNPFNPNTIIEFSIPFSSFVRLSVFDILGNEVESLISQELRQGKYKISFNAANLSSGIYLYRIVTEKYTATKKLILIK